MSLCLVLMKAFMFNSTAQPHVQPPPHLHHLPFASSSLPQYSSSVTLFLSSHHHSISRVHTGLFTSFHCAKSFFSPMSHSLSLAKKESFINHDKNTADNTSVLIRPPKCYLEACYRSFFRRLRLMRCCKNWRKFECKKIM